MSRESEDPWGAHASSYDRVFAPLTQYIARSMLAMTESRTPVDARVLDIACGSGALLLPALERAQRRRARGGTDFVVGCDYSRGMVDLAKGKATALHDADAFRCEVQDGQALTDDDATYDAVFSCFGIFLFPDRAAGWREAARVLKPGGVFATSTWLAPEHNDMFRAQFEPIMQALPARVVEGLTPPGWLEVAEAEGLEAEARAAGFSALQTTVFRTEFVLRDAETAWTTMLENPAGGALLRQCSEQEQAAVKESFLRGMAERASGPGRPIVLEAVCNILVGTRP